MKRITVSASRTYDIIIGNGLIEKVGSHLLAVKKTCRAVILSDSNVWPLFGSSVSDSLTTSGYTPLSFVFPAGEQSKTADTYLQILNFLAQKKITRSDLIIALGGGVVGDMAGFVAATYLRGIAYVQVPTTLLAMVDSSVGGKTAIDLPAGKNLVGAFYQPSLVLCDIDALRTLPQDIFRDGCAEVIKYSVLYDKPLFAHLLNNGMAFDREFVISTCIAWKQRVVAEDEFDTGARQKLNLGHTIGHAVESCSKFTLSHGQSVAIGMAIICRSGVKNQITKAEDSKAILHILHQFGFPTGTDYPASILCDVALSDKKRAGNTINLIIPQTIGNCDIVATDITQLQSFIEAGLTEWI